MYTINKDNLNFPICEGNISGTIFNYNYNIDMYDRWWSDSKAAMVYGYEFTVYNNKEYSNENTYFLFTVNKTPVEIYEVILCEDFFKESVKQFQNELHEDLQTAILMANAVQDIAKEVLNNTAFITNM